MSSASDGSGHPAADLVSAMGRRKHYRVDCDLPVSYTIATTGQTGTARAVNIGLGGTRVDFPCEIIIPADVQLTVSFPTGEATVELDVLARVVWTVTDRIEGPYPTGLQFQELPDDERRKLYELIGLLMS